MSDKTEKTWYLAILVVASVVKDGEPNEPLVALQYKLLRAADHDEAYERALKLGDQEHVKYTNAHGDEVEWRCVGLHDLCPIDAPRLTDGVEIYSSMQYAEPNEFLCAKTELTAYWSEANKYRALAEMLGPVHEKGTAE